MGKKKNKNKVSGAVKTAVKTEKKLANKLKKQLADLGEEDIAKVIAEIEKEEAKRSAPTERVLTGPPSPRAYASLTPHPTNNELIMFGGEYHDGKQTLVYNDLFLYNPEKESWRQLQAQGAPPPRSAHQAVSSPANKGELWIFGGEFTSPSETQFYHFRDLWCFSLADKKWEKVIAPNGPSPRSGHRMVLVNRKLLVFGGYHDDGRQCRYYDELYSFCLESRVWSKLTPSGRGPCARSACLMIAAGDSVIIYGGFSRVKEGRTERTLTHTDMFRLTMRDGGYSWKPLSVSGPSAPPPRSGQSAAVNVQAGRAYVFGGILDVEETEDEIRGEMSDSLLLIDVETARWHPVALKSEHTHPVKMEQETSAAPTEPEQVTVVTDEVFTMKLGGAASTPAPVTSASPASPGAARTGTGPSPRMSAMMAVHRSVLYVYGGLMEKDEKQFYLSDMYSLDLHKLSEWRTLAAQPKLPEWLGTDSEFETSEENDASGSDSDSESDT